PRGVVRERTDRHRGGATVSRVKGPISYQAIPKARKRLTFSIFHDLALVTMLAIASDRHDAREAPGRPRPWSVRRWRSPVCPPLPQRTGWPPSPFKRWLEKRARPPSRLLPCAPRTPVVTPGRRSRVRASRPRSRRMELVDRDSP